MMQLRAYMIEVSITPFYLLKRIDWPRSDNTRRAVVGSNKHVWKGPLRQFSILVIFALPIQPSLWLE